jgi:hypothetical protein
MGLRERFAGVRLQTPASFLPRPAAGILAWLQQKFTKNFSVGKKNALRRNFFFFAMRYRK